MRITAKTKKWIAVASIVVLSAYNITSPIILKDIFPAWISSPNLINIAAYLSLLGAYWVSTRQVD